MRCPRFTLIEFLICAALACLIVLPFTPRLLATGMEIKVNTTPGLDVVFLNASNSTYDNGIIDLNTTTVSCYFQRAGGALTALTNFTLTQASNTTDKGHYKLVFNSTVSNTTGPLYLKCNATGAAPFRNYYDVVAYKASDVYAALAALTNVTLHTDYDAAKSAGTSTLAASDLAALTNVSLHSDYDPAKSAGTSTLAVSDLAALTNVSLHSDYDAAKSAGTSTLTASDLSALTNVSLAADQSAVTIGTVTTLTNAPSDSTGVTTLVGLLTATRAGYLDNLTNLDAAVSGAATTAALAAVDAKIDTAQADLDDTAQYKADVSGLPTTTQVTAAFTEIKGATWASTDTLEAIRDRGDSAWITATGFGTSTLTADVVKTAIETDGSKIDHLWETTEDDGGVRRFTTNSLEQAPSGGATTTQITDALLDESVGAHTASGSVGEALSNAGGDSWATDLPGSYTGADAAAYLIDLIKKTRGR